MENISEEVQMRLIKLEDAKVALNSNLDTLFILFVSIIIFFMQCGFAFLECGAVRSKNATNILWKNMFDPFIGAVAYWLVGYAFAFGQGNSFIGYSYFAHYHIPAANIPQWFFQFVFAATAVTIVSGAVAERCHLVAYFVYSLALTGFVYPVVTHWAWSGQGWLGIGAEYTTGAGETFTASYEDFAGSGVVHLVGGAAALVGAVLIGPRIGRFDKKTDETEFRGHSVPLTALGGFILIFGFFAFNGGSQGSISKPNDGVIIATACINTIVSAAFGSFVSLVMSRLMDGFKKGNWRIVMTINGALIGMVAICAGCDVLSTWAAAVTGFVSGFVLIFWSKLLIKLKIDDPLDAFAVHAGGGIWGLIARPIFKPDGIVFRWDIPSFYGLAWQLIGIGAIAAWVIVLMIIVFAVLKVFHLLRVTSEQEIEGLDSTKHGEPAYTRITSMRRREMPENTNGEVTNLNAVLERINSVYRKCAPKYNQNEAFVNDEEGAEERSLKSIKVNDLNNEVSSKTNDERKRF